MMKYIFLSVLISLIGFGIAFAGIPDDADLLLWIGEGSGNKAVDGTGNGNDGTFGGNAKWVAGQGKYAAGIALRGAESFLEVPNTIAEAGSLLFWFRPDWDGGDGEDYRLFDGKEQGTSPVSGPSTSLSARVRHTRTSRLRNSGSILKPQTMAIGKMWNLCIGNCGLWVSFVHHRQDRSEGNYQGRGVVPLRHHVGFRGRSTLPLH